MVFYEDQIHEAIRTGLSILLNFQVVGINQTTAEKYTGLLEQKRQGFVAPTFYNYRHCDTTLIDE